MTAMQFAGWIGRYPFHQYFLPFAGIILTIAVPSFDDLPDYFCQGVLGDTEIDESRISYFYRLCLRECTSQFFRNRLCDFSRAFMQLLGKTHRHTGAVVSHFRIPRCFHCQNPFCINSIDGLYCLFHCIIDQMFKITHFTYLCLFYKKSPCGPFLQQRAEQESNPQPPGS